MTEDQFDPEWVTPLGKKLRDCTRAEVGAIGRWFEDIAKLGTSADGKVGEGVTEEQLRALLMKHLEIASAEEEAEDSSKH